MLHIETHIIAAPFKTRLAGFAARRGAAASGGNRLRGRARRAPLRTPLPAPRAAPWPIAPSRLAGRKAHELLSDVYPSADSRQKDSPSGRRQARLAPGAPSEQRADVQVAYPGLDATAAAQPAKRGRGRPRRQAQGGADGAEGKAAAAAAAAGEAGRRQEERKETAPAPGDLELCFLKDIRFTIAPRWTDGAAALLQRLGPEPALGTLLREEWEATYTHVTGAAHFPQF